MKVMALDIATQITGYAIYKDDIYIESGTLVSKGENARIRFTSMSQSLLQLIKKHRPDTIVVEAAFMGRNFKTTEYLVKLQGIAEWGALTLGAGFTSVVTTAWRGVLQFPNALHTKEKIDYKAISITMAREFSGKDITDDNEADAVCIGKAYPILLLRQQGKCS